VPDEKITDVHISQSSLQHKEGEARGDCRWAQTLSVQAGGFYGL